MRAAHWNNARMTLSALCDRGKWFFPNKFEEQHGTHKEPAYRGIRRRILDHLVSAYKALPKCPSYGDFGSRDSLVASQRAFVSEVQTVLNPRHREQQVSAVVERFGIAEQMRAPTDNEK